MLPAVVLDVPADLASTAVQVAVSRCDKALGDGRCRRVEYGTAPGVLGYYAVLRWSEDEQLEIEFRAASAGGALLARRRLSFSANDSVESRWASAGLVVAALVAEADAGRARRTEAPQPPAHAPPRRHVVEAPPAYAWGLDVALSSGRGLTTGAGSWGGLLRPWFGVPTVPVIVLSSLRYAQGPDSPRLRWLSMSAGVGSRFGRPAALVNLELAGELVFERLVVAAQDPESGRSETGGQTRFGGRLGLNLALRASDCFRVLLGADVATLTPPVKIEVRDEVVGREPLVRAGVSVGARFAL